MNLVPCNANCPEGQVPSTISNICYSSSVSELCPATVDTLITTKTLSTPTCVCPSTTTSTEGPTALATTTPTTPTTAPITTTSNIASSTTNANIASSDTTSNSEPVTTTSNLKPTTHSTTSATSSAILAPGDGTITPGAAAGIGVGCALAGALLAGLIVFLLLRRKRRQTAYPQQHLPSNRSAYGEQEKHGRIATNALVQRGAVTNIDRLLPQPAEDDAIIGALSRIRDGIKNHVQNYYHSAPVKHDVVDEARLVQLANTTAVPTSVIKKLLLSPETRVPTIRLFLAQLILSRCTGRTDGQLSFLPSEISILAAFPIGSDGTTASQTALFSKWKTISGALLQQQYGHQVDENDPRAGSIKQALAVSEPTLDPFINPNTEMNARRRNLESIMRRAAQFAFLLFSQPGSFQFDYTGTRQPDGLPVFPAFLQTINDEAQPISPPRVLREKEVITGLSV